MVLQNVLVHAEILIHVLRDDLHRVSVNGKRLRCNLLDIPVSVREQEQTASLGILGKVLSREAFAFLRQVFRLREVFELCHEPIGCGRLHALLDALILHMDQLHRGEQSMVRFAEEIILVLHPCHHAAVFQLNRAPLAECELIPQIRNLVVLDYLAPLWDRSIDPADFSVLVPHRNKEQGIAVIENGRCPREELRPRLELVRPMLKLSLQGRLRGSEGFYIKF